MKNPSNWHLEGNRKLLLLIVLILSIAALLSLPSVPSAETPQDQTAYAAAKVLPVEDLLREHGVLNRSLLIYEAAIARLNSGGQLPQGTLEQAADIVHTFVENYHEKLEEDYVFSRYKSGPLKDLSDTLHRQHNAGRKLTTYIQAHAVPKDQAEHDKLVEDMRQFIRMYRVHAPREATVLFPAFHASLTAAEYEKLGDTFESKEHQQFGEHGFENIVGRVEQLEKQLGIYDLSQFTPSAQ